MTPDTAGALARLIPSLLVLLAALFAVRWWARRQGGGVSREVRVLSRTGLSRGAALVAVQVGERRLLLGVTDHAVNLVTELPAEPAELDVTDLQHTQHSSAAMDAADLPASLADMQGPRMGLVDRLREKTVRSAPPRPPRVRS